MIRVTIYYQNDLPEGLLIKGHAGKEEYGHDLVCASVSAVVTGGFNAFKDEEIKEIILEEGYAKLIVNNSKEAIIKLNMLITQLETIKEAEPDYLEIK